MKRAIKTISKSNFSIFGIITSLLLFFAIGCNTGPPKNSRAAQQISGEKLFNEQCVNCHGGKELAADKIVTDTLTAIPPDLTRIMKRRGVMEFPVSEIARIIDGRILLKAHGPRDMPVWGKVYEDEGMEEGQIKGKKGELIAYLMSIQTMNN